jgi:predicted PurR-regulated permease PerM
MLSDSQKWLLLAVTLAGGFLLYLLAPVLTPFLAAALLAYLGDPLVDRMEAKGLPRTVAVVVMFVVFLSLLAGLVLLLVPALQQQLVSLAKALPAYVDWLQLNLAPWLSQTFGIDAAMLDWSTLKSTVQENWSQVGSAAGGFMSWLTSSSMALLAVLANLVLIPVVTFYLLRDWDHLMNHLRSLLPRKWESTAVQLATDSDTVLGAFLRGQLLVMLVLATVYSLGLWWVGLELALIIGVVAGLVSFVPYLGFIIGILLAGVAAMMQFHEVYYLLLVGAVFGVGQALEGMVLTPMLVGDKIGLHPVAVIFAVMAGGQLFGFVGVMLALPAAAVIMVLLRYAHRQYQQSELYADS